MTSNTMSWDRTDLRLSLLIGHRREHVPGLLSALLLRDGISGLTDDPARDLLRLDIDLECYARHLASGVADAAEELAYARDAVTLAEGEGGLAGRRYRRLTWEYLGRASELYMLRDQRYRCMRRWIDRLHRYVVELAVPNGPLVDAAARWHQAPRPLSETATSEKIATAAEPVAGGAVSLVAASATAERSAQDTSGSRHGPHEPEERTMSALATAATRGRVAAWVAASGTALLLAGCTAGGHAIASAPAPRPAARTTTTALPTRSTPDSPAAAAKRQALTAYRGMWAAFVSAGHTSDWRSPQLSKYATGVALTNLARSLYTDHTNGLVTKGQPVLKPRVSSAIPSQDPITVIVSDCGDSTDWLKYRVDNGTLADDTPGGRQLINAVVQRQSDGTWKVSDYGVHDVGTC